MDKDKIMEAIKENSSEGHINCEAAFKIVKEQNCTPREVGDICNKLNIKIVNCQLGCF